MQDREESPLSDSATDATVAQRTALKQGEGAHKVPLDRLPKKSEASLHARHMAYQSWGLTEDRTERTAPGRAAFEARFLREADGDPQRAEALRKAYYANLARQSVAARRANREARENGAA